MECNEQIEFDYMDNEKYIYKSNNLVESSYSLSLNAQRLIYMGAKKLKPIFIKSNIRCHNYSNIIKIHRYIIRLKPVG